MYAWTPFLMRQYPVDATRHAQVGLGKVVAGVELQCRGDTTFVEELFHGARVIKYVSHHAVGRLGFLFAE